MKHLILFCLPLSVALLVVGCGGGGGESAASADLVKLHGEAQGTTYVVSYLDGQHRNFQVQVDSILAAIDGSMSTYVDESVLLSFNNADSISAIDSGLARVFECSKQIHAETGGSFDPTVMPLIEFWGFGTDKILAVESINMAILDSIQQYVGLEKVMYVAGATGPELHKTVPGVRLNFNAIAQGYSVDVVANFLEAKNVGDYLVEIGGEVRVKGKNASGKLWSVGIDKPQDESQYGRELQAIIALDNRSVATSGNYRKYYIKDGVKYSHTLDPKTGFPVQHSLLSATIFASDCTFADGYATAFMVMGLQRSQVFLRDHPELDAYLIYADASGQPNTFMTTGVEKIIREQN